MDGDTQVGVSLDEFDFTIESPRTGTSADGVLLDLCNIEITEEAVDSNVETVISQEHGVGDVETKPELSQPVKECFIEVGINSDSCDNVNNASCETDRSLEQCHDVKPEVKVDVLGSEQTEPITGEDVVSAESGDVEVIPVQSREFTDICPQGGTNMETTDEFSSINTEQKNEDLNGETVSLDNILVTTDKQEFDSDGEFDFDLPVQHKVEETGSNVQVTSTTTVLPVSVPSQQQAEGSTYVKPVAVVQPSSHVLNIIKQAETKAPIDSKTQAVLEAAQNEWDNVTTIQAGFRDASTTRGTEPTVVQTVKPMSPHELIEIIKTTDFSSVLPSIRTCVERHGFAAFINFLFGPPKMHRELWDDRDRIFCIAATQLNNENSSHMRTLQTIYRCLTGSKFDCARIGSHWEEIGFQGTDPATDLRGAGMLGLLNLLYFLKDPRRQNLASDIYRLSLHPTQNFPFCVMGINLSRIALQALRENVLNKMCNKQNDVFAVVNEFYVGMYLQLYLTWKQGKTISDSGFIIKELEARAKKNPGDILKGLTDYLEKKKTIVIPMSKDQDLGTDDFVNVCEDTK